MIADCAVISLLALPLTRYVTFIDINEESIHYD